MRRRSQWANIDSVSALVDIGLEQLEALMAALVVLAALQVRSARNRRKR
jgi:hypothetical protein